MRQKNKLNLTDYKVQGEIKSTFFSMLNNDHCLIRRLNAFKAYQNFRDTATLHLNIQVHIDRKRLSCSCGVLEHNSGNIRLQKSN